MGLSDIATITVSSAGAGVTRAGFGVPMIMSYTATWPERTRTYTSIDGVGVDFPTNSAEYIAASKIFGQAPKVAAIVIGRGANLPTARWTLSVPASVLGPTQALNAPFKLRLGVPTGAAYVSQDALYNPGAGATGWQPSGTWNRGDLVVSDNSKLYTCITGGIGAASGPSGTATSIAEGTAAWMYAGSGATGGISNDSVINGLRAKVDALNSPPVTGGGTGQLTSSLIGSAGARQLRLQANAAGKFFGLRVYDRNVLISAMDHQDPGVAADLAAIALENNTWYGLVTMFNSQSLIDAAAAWVETNTKLYPAASADTVIPRQPVTSDTSVAIDLKNLGYARSWIFFHPQNDEFAGAAEMGKFFPVSPGGETWRMKTLAGVTVEPYTDTETTNLKAKFCHYYYDIGGRGVVGGDAKDAAGEYVDVVRFLDWYQSELQADLADLAIGLDKIPFTNQGIDLIEAKVTKRNAAGIAAGGIAPDPAPTVTAPDILDVSTADKQARELEGVVTEWTLAGAVHHIDVKVTANP